MLDSWPNHEGIPSSANVGMMKLDMPHWTEPKTSFAHVSKPNKETNRSTFFLCNSKITIRLSTSKRSFIGVHGTSFPAPMNPSIFRRL